MFTIEYIVAINTRRRSANSFKHMSFMLFAHPTTHRSNIEVTIKKTSHLRLHLPYYVEWSWKCPKPCGMHGRSITITFDTRDSLYFFSYNFMKALWLIEWNHSTRLEVCGREDWIKKQSRPWMYLPHILKWRYSWMGATSLSQTSWSSSCS